MLTPQMLRAAFDRGLSYDQYVSGGTPDQRESWSRALSRVALSPAQRELVASFTRRMPVLVTSGLWCGDCSAQCPMLSRIAEANPCIELRFVDRDREKELAEHVRICGGLRVPTVIFMNEDYEFVALRGDKSLTRLRAIAARQLGAACAVSWAETPADEAAATLSDWLGDFELAQLTLRLSPRLRERHAD